MTRLKKSNISESPPHFRHQIQFSAVKEDRCSEIVLVSVSTRRAFDDLNFAVQIFGCAVRYAIQSFQQMKIHTILLTGDNRRTADAIARELRIDDVRAEVLPADKEAVIRSLTDKNNAVAMIGDGINDAPQNGAAAGANAPAHP